MLIDQLGLRIPTWNTLYFLHVDILFLTVRKKAEIYQKLIFSESQHFIRSVPLL